MYSELANICCCTFHLKKIDTGRLCFALRANSPRALEFLFPHKLSNDSRNVRTRRYGTRRYDEQLIQSITYFLSGLYRKFYQPPREIRVYRNIHICDPISMKFRSSVCLRDKRETIASTTTIIDGVNKIPRFDKKRVISHDCGKQTPKFLVWWNRVVNADVYTAEKLSVRI